MLRGLALAQAELLQIEPALETAWRAIDAMERSGAAADEIADFAAAIAIALKHRAGATIEQWSPFVTFGLQRVQSARGLGWARLSFVLEPVQPVSRGGIRAGIWTGFDPEAVAIARSKGTEEDQARSFESFDNRTRDETDALIALARGFRNPYARLHAFTVAANDLQYSHGAFRDALRIWKEVDTMAERNGVVGWQAQARNQRALLEIAQGNFALAAETEDEANTLLARLGPGRRPELFAMEMATARACYLGGAFDELADFWISFADDPTLGPMDAASLLGPFFAAVGAFAATEAGQAEKARATLTILTPLLARLPLDAPNHNGSVAFAALSVMSALRGPIGEAATACAIIDVITDKTRTSSSREGASVYTRSALSVPTTSRPILIGTQRKEMSFFRGLLPRPVLLRNSGSSVIFGTTMGWPVATTLPVIPSPVWYRPSFCCVADKP